MFPNPNSSTIGILNLYEFETESERDIWIDSDLSAYSYSDDALSYWSKSRFPRKPCPDIDAGMLMQYGKLPIRLKAHFSSSYIYTDKLTGHYLNIQPFTDSDNHPFISAFQNGISGFPFFGITLRFDSRKCRRRFIDSHKQHFGDKMTSLKKSSPILKTAKSNGLIVNFNFDDPILPSQISYALNNFSEIDPSKNYLALVCFKDWSSPQIFSFIKKSSRDLFINKVKGIKHSPVNVFSISNFNPIAILASTKGSIFKGTLSTCLDFISTYRISKVTFSANSAICSEQISVLEASTAS